MDRATSEIVSALKSKTRKELRELAKLLRMTRYSQLKKADLIAEILRAENQSQLGQALGLSSAPRNWAREWWARHHSHVYGGVTVLGVLLTVAFFLIQVVSDSSSSNGSSEGSVGPPSQRPATAEEQSSPPIDAILDDSEITGALVNGQHRLAEELHFIVRNDGGRAGAVTGGFIHLDREHLGIGGGLSVKLIPSDGRPVFIPSGAELQVVLKSTGPLQYSQGDIESIEQFLDNWDSSNNNKACSLQLDVMNSSGLLSMPSLHAYCPTVWPMVADAYADLKSLSERYGT